MPFHRDHILLITIKQVVIYVSIHHNVPSKNLALARHRADAGQLRPGVEPARNGLGATASQRRGRTGRPACLRPQVRGCGGYSLFTLRRARSPSKWRASSSSSEHPIDYIELAVKQARPIIMS